MHIRKTTFDDLPQVMAIYQDARDLMEATNNPTQWGKTHPVQSLIEGDIHQGLSYVCTHSPEANAPVLAVFFFDTRPDKTYGHIDGAWQQEGPYGVIHRIARGKNAKGAGRFCLEWCYEQIPNIRIDTHENNGPMRALLETLGYVYCGNILLEDGAPRMAFQKCS